MIIDARRQLSWNRRLFSDVSTLALWSMWLWMCRPVLFGTRHAFAHGLPTHGVLALEDVVAALIGTCIVLMLWNRLASQPAPTPRINLAPDYSGHFGLDPRELALARSSSICVVHHDELGRILCIDCDCRDASQHGRQAIAA
jgi:poly-beta-1,6-N-acetyl-D-glucosamine biosynthesis protein PgaD